MGKAGEMGNRSREEKLKGREQRPEKESAMPLYRQAEQEATQGSGQQVTL